MYRPTTALQMEYMEMIVLRIKLHGGYKKCKKVWGGTKILWSYKRDSSAIYDAFALFQKDCCINVVKTDLFPCSQQLKTGSFTI